MVRRRDGTVHEFVCTFPPIAWERVLQMTNCGPANVMNAPKPLRAHRKHVGGESNASVAVKSESKAGDQLQEAQQFTGEDLFHEDEQTG